MVQSVGMARPASLALCRTRNSLLRSTASVVTTATAMAHCSMPDRELIGEPPRAHCKHRLILLSSRELIHEPPRAHCKHRLILLSSRFDVSRSSFVGGGAHGFFHRGLSSGHGPPVDVTTVGEGVRGRRPSGGNAGGAFAPPAKKILPFHAVKLAIFREFCHTALGLGSHTVTVSYTHLTLPTICSV